MHFMSKIGKLIRPQIIHRINGSLTITNKTAFYATIAENFENAKIKSKSLSEDPDNDTKLKMYALFKQGTEGVVQTKRPGMTNFVGRAKWDAWKDVEQMTQEQAQKAYTDLIDELAGADESSQSPQEVTGKYKYIKVEMDGGIRKITLNRPNKKNALLFECYDEWMAALDEGAADPKTILTVITGAGDYFSSGNDLSFIKGITPENIHEMAKYCTDQILKFVAKHIDYPKPIVAIVNGPAIGIAVTILCHFDLVYASDKATFVTPFTSLGQAAEGCSSLLFPQRMGLGKACEMLLFNKKITAQEAFDRNLVTEVFSHDSLQSTVWPMLQTYAKLPKGSLKAIKKNICIMDRKILHEMNKLECDTNIERLTSDECKNAIMKFFTGKS